MKARTFELKEIGPQGGFKYRVVLEQMLMLPSNPQVGMQMAEIRSCNKILDELEKSNGALILNQDQHEFLKKRAENWFWGAGGKSPEQFVKDLADAPEVEVSASPDKGGSA